MDQSAWPMMADMVVSAQNQEKISSTTCGGLLVADLLC